MNSHPVCSHSTSVCMGKNYWDNVHSIKNTGKDLTMKQMFDMSEKMTVGQSDEIFWVTPMNWEDSSWKQLSLVGDEEVISLSHAKVHVFSDSVLCLGKMNENPTIKFCLRREVDVVQKFITIRNLDTIDGEPMEFEWNVSQDSPHCSSATKSKSSCRNWAKSQDNLQDGSSSCRCLTTSHGDLKTMNRNANLAPTSFLFVQEDFHQEDGHLSDLDQKISGGQGDGAPNACH